MPRPSSRSSRRAEVPQLEPSTEARGLRRALLAAVAIVLMAAGAVSAAGLLQIKGLQKLIPKQNTIDGVDVDVPDAGKPQTIMALGTDGRLGADAGGGERSDTILLARLDPANRGITLTSIPRDLRVNIPGYGLDKINAAFTLGGTKLVVKTVKELLSTPGHPFKINHVVEVNFTGFRKLVDYFGCVFIDVDRHYFNDFGGPGGYAVIDVPAGYQRMCGTDALSYVRYRHTDSDLVRAARQQDFLRQMLRQPEVRSRLTFSKRKELVKLAGTYTRTDRGLSRSTKQLLSLLKLGLGVAGKPVLQIPFARTGLEFTMVNSISYLEASKPALQKTVNTFMSPPAPKPPKKEIKKAPLDGLSNFTSAGYQQVRTVGRDIGIRLYFPKYGITGSSYTDVVPRVYRLHGLPAYRFSVKVPGKVGAYYGIEGMGWRDPPILSSPHNNIIVERRHLQVYPEGNKIATVLWRTPHAVYYVRNTLTRDLTRGQMLTIARSLTIIPPK